jgi:hypothetical protein
MNIFIEVPVSSIFRSTDVVTMLNVAVFTAAVPFHNVIVEGVPGPTHVKVRYQPFLKLMPMTDELLEYVVLKYMVPFVPCEYLLWYFSAAFGRVIPLLLHVKADVPLSFTQSVDVCKTEVLDVESTTEPFILV